MKIRNIPFGYTMENGKILCHPTESQAVQDIFSDYLDGQSLLRIAKNLNERQVEYLPGTTGWNKARLKRIIEDKRYIGNASYPPIIEQSIYDKAPGGQNFPKHTKNSRPHSRYFQAAASGYL